MQDVADGTGGDMFERWSSNPNDEGVSVDLDRGAMLNGGHTAWACASNTERRASAIGRRVARLERARFRRNQRRDPAGVARQYRHDREEQRTAHVGRFYNGYVADLSCFAGTVMVPPISQERELRPRHFNSTRTAYESFFNGMTTI
jgi:hypothetical protein